MHARKYGPQRYDAIWVGGTDEAPIVATAVFTTLAPSFDVWLAANGFAALEATHPLRISLITSYAPATRKSSCIQARLLETLCWNAITAGRKTSSFLVSSQPNPTRWSSFFADSLALPCLPLRI